MAHVGDDWRWCAPHHNDWGSTHWFVVRRDGEPLRCECGEITVQEHMSEHVSAAYAREGRWLRISVDIEPAAPLSVEIRTARPMPPGYREAGIDRPVPRGTHRWLRWALGRHVT